MMQLVVSIVFLAFIYFCNRLIADWIVVRRNMYLRRYPGHPFEVSTIAFLTGMLLCISFNFTVLRAVIWS